jgi:hypothetical protein
VAAARAALSCGLPQELRGSVFASWHEQYTANHQKEEYETRKLHFQQSHGEMRDVLEPLSWHCRHDKPYLISPADSTLSFIVPHYLIFDLFLY